MATVMGEKQKKEAAEEREEAAVEVEVEEIKQAMAAAEGHKIRPDNPVSLSLC